MTEEVREEAEPARSAIYPVNAAHMMRTAQLAQLQLSAMADAKANILIGAAFVIFAITIGQARGGTPPLPLLILGGAAFLAAICAVLAVLPMTKSKRTSSRPNLLFFGTFSQMEEEAFIDEVTARLKTEDNIYRTMARDIHQAGTVLATKKYRMLGWAYRIFLLGLVASCAAFVIQQFL
ncbi:MAG TPA: Pycsar system effector family protein [Allosphingosinicella sp.]|nr:Pycsar system effector family protein [Allosphingosinicella sp.]